MLTNQLCLGNHIWNLVRLPDASNVFEVIALRPIPVLGNGFVKGRCGILAEDLEAKGDAAQLPLVL